MKNQRDMCSIQALFQPPWWDIASLNSFRPFRETTADFEFIKIRLSGRRPWDSDSIFKDEIISSRALVLARNFIKYLELVKPMIIQCLDITLLKLELKTYKIKQVSTKVPIHKVQTSPEFASKIFWPNHQRLSAYRSAYVWLLRGN